MAARPAPVPELMDELVEEILVRIPPDDPALVCKRWGHIVSMPSFRRRFREFHRTHPLLGFFRNDRRKSFVSTSSFRRPPAAIPNFHRLIDARHGRVLLWNNGCRCIDDDFAHLGDYLTVWDPIMGESSELPMPPMSERPVNWNAAVLCADTGGACDQLDCGRGHFLVVYVCNSRTGMLAHVYSSEAATWSEEITAQYLGVDNILMYTQQCALIGNALYFMCATTILKYDLAAREMYLIRLPCVCTWLTILRTTEGGRLGLANISSDGLYLYLWSREVGPDEDVGWAQMKVVKLTKLLPDVPLYSLRPAGFAHGLDVIIVESRKGTFTIDMKSVRATKVHKEEKLCYMYVPYMSFCTPELGAASGEGPRTGSSNA